MKYKYLTAIALCVVLLLCALYSEKGIVLIKNILSYKKDNITVVIDVGHGGFDPGKIGVNKVKEKDLNLSIALKVKNLLEKADIKVVMTRTEDKALSDSNKKRDDMNKRIEIINKNNALFAISIHQNSFTNANEWGAQMFYYQNSDKGKQLADILQKSFLNTMNDGNRRKARFNNSYYLLKYSRCPLVIVECGFLSNWKEAELLCEESYQDKAAWAIYMGVIEYINTSTGLENEDGNYVKKIPEGP